MYKVPWSISLIHYFRLSFKRWCILTIHCWKLPPRLPPDIHIRPFSTFTGSPSYFFQQQQLSPTFGHRFPPPSDISNFFQHLTRCIRCWYFVGLFGGSYHEFTPNCHKNKLRDWVSWKLDQKLAKICCLLWKKSNVQFQHHFSISAPALIHSWGW